MSDKELLELAAKAAGFGAPGSGTIWTLSEYPKDQGDTAHYGITLAAGIPLNFGTL